jgi:hypothetical protein
MPRAGLARVAAVAAVFASAGDLLLLYVANARRPELGLPPAPGGALALGGALGVVAIPLYALGYRAAAGLVPRRSAASARTVAGLGAVAAIAGAAIHGLTARAIHIEAAAAAPAADPLAGLLASTPLLLLWALAALCVLAASCVLAIRTLGSPLLAERLAAIANPALLTVALVAIGLATPLGRAFLAPAAPNLAHAAFFALCARALALRSPRGAPSA